MSAGLLILIVLVAVIVILTAAILTGTRRRMRVPPASPRREIIDTAWNELGTEADRAWR